MSAHVRNLSLILITLIGASSAGAQEADANALLQRLEKLERRNEELRRALESRQSGVSTQAAGEVDAKSVEAIVGAYLKKQDEAKKKADAAKANEFAEVGSDMSFKSKWSNGVTFESPLKDFKVHIGGRLQFDMGWHAPDPEVNFPPFLDAMGLRRARLRADGSFWEVFNWVAEFDFATGAAVATDVYIEATKLPVVGTFRAGHFKEWFSFEELISDNYITFMDRTLFNEAFGLGRRLGLGTTNAYLDDRVTLSLGFFRNQLITTTDFGDGEYDYNGRITWNPIYAEDGRCALHFGASYKHSMYETDPAAGGGEVIYRARTLRIGDGSGSPRIIQASGGALATVDHADFCGGEFCWIWGPLSVQAEIATSHNDTDGVNTPDPTYWGSYIQVSYFLTGEHRPYNRKSAVVERVKPNEPFFLVRGDEESGKRLLFGKGAWEVAARWDYLDLRDTGVRRTGNPPTGILQDMVLGVNWYWTSNARVMFNYVRAWRDSDAGDGIGANRSGTVDSFGIRFHCDF
jgi:phosphate-selective porin OprO and OprP